jgi:heme oxygenase
VEEYTASLLRYVVAYAALERRIDVFATPLEAVGLDWGKRRKVPLLERDLAALGSHATPRVALPPGAVPQLETLPHVIGCLYVLEGATLGGKVIARSLEKVLRLTADHGASFFNSYGAAVGAYWQELCAVLERSLTDVPSRSRAAEAATATFDLFANHVAP